MRRILAVSAITVTGAFATKSYFFAKEEKQTIVVLGSGWSSVAFLSDIDTNKYNVYIVSPRNYFLFTPLLPGTTTGTIESRTITEPIRSVIQKINPKVTFYEAACTAIDTTTKQITCTDVSPFKSSVENFTLKYDKLVLGVGSHSNTFGTKGVTENCFFLKNLEDGALIRNRIIDVMETASIPGIPVDEIKQLCSFVVVGGGPTGVEFAGELRDMMEDLQKTFPHLKPYFKISLIQSADHILNSYSEQISKYAEKKFVSRGIDVITNARVLEVLPNKIMYQNKKENKVCEQPYGMCVWSTGIKPIPLITNFISKIPEQKNRVAITTDPYLHVKGTSDVYAMGDCGTVESEKCLEKLLTLFNEADANHDGSMSIDEFTKFMHTYSIKFPQLRHHSKKIAETFKEHDLNHDNKLDQKEFAELLKEADREITSFPPTAQVASQQGTYLASYLNGKLKSPFVYNHRGSFASIGGSESLLDVEGHTFSGLHTWLAWRGVYFSKQLSLKGRACLAWDWTKTLIFGRDLSRQ
jgi:NADH:ubiquinone reductase (non-electrogenic)